MSVTAGSAGDDRLRHHISTALDRDMPKALGVAVSGGGDSMALLHLLAEAAPDRGIALAAATVNHGLRPEAAEEAAFVAATCRSLGIPHETLPWQGWDGSGNLQAEARAARYRLLAGWARGSGLDAVALGHTLDDQAETFLMRLAREAGVDGLAAMDRRFERDGARFLRPALALERAELRGFLTRQGHAWREDPSNHDARFDRVRARKALALLEDLELTAVNFAAVAQNLHWANVALDGQAQAAARAAVTSDAAGDLVFDLATFGAQPWEIQRRLLSRALAWVASAPYPPRRAALADAARAAFAGSRHSLHGCLLVPSRGRLRVSREYNAVKDLAVPFGTLWDGRWQVTGPGEGLTLRALGKTGLGLCPDWRQTGLPRAALIAGPAVFDRELLVAAPLAGKSEGFSATIAPGRDDFVLSFLTH